MFNILIFTLILLSSFLFAMLGLGGGMVYIPILKWAGLDFKNVAIPLGLLLNGLNTLLALIPYHREKLVDYRGMWPMGVTAVIFAPIGALATSYISKSLLVILFALLVLIAALKVFYDLNKANKKQKMMSVSGISNQNIVAAETKMYTLQQKQLIGGTTGAGIGFIGGLLGIGGGFIIAPILMMLGYKTKEAAATTAFVVTFSSFAGYLGHISKGIPLNWLTLLATLAVIIGSQLGSNFMIKKAKGSTVKLIYGITLILIALKIIFDLFY